jgi:ferritin
MVGFDVYTVEVQKYIKEVLGLKITEIDKTTLKRIKLMIDEGITEGQSIKKIANKINILISFAIR